jgi:RNA polymerase sigma-70 factor, ECF subfamily
MDCGRESSATDQPSEFEALSTVAVDAVPDITSRPSPADAIRFEQVARDSFQFIWRCMRRFGIHPDHAVDDAVQRVFEIAATRLQIIEPGRERAFLFKTAMFVARELRRKFVHTRESVDLERTLAELDTNGDPEQLLEQRRWRLVLDELLESLPMDLRTVFVLYELEGMRIAEIASLLDLPQGTASSRLRRAREAFVEKGERIKAQFGHRTRTA